MLISKRNRPRGKKIALYSLLVCIISFVIASTGNSDNAESVEESSDAGTITASTDATDDEKESSEEPVFTYNADSLNADKKGMFSLNIKVNDGYKPKIFQDNSDIGAFIKKKDENNYELKGIIDPSEQSGSYHLVFSNNGKEQDEIIEIANTLAYSPASAEEENTEDIDVEQTNDDYAYDVEFDVEQAIGETYTQSGKKTNIVKEIQVNDNLAKDDGSKLILLYLNASPDYYDKKIDDKTLEVLEEIKNDDSLDFKIDSVVFFWQMAVVDSYGKNKTQTAYKIEIDNSTMNKINYKNKLAINLSEIATQYNKFIK